MLSNEQVDKLSLMLQTSGWCEVVVPIFAQRGQTLIKLLCMAPERREEGMSDDTIRGRLEEIEYLLSAFQKEVRVNHENRMREQQNGTDAPQGQASLP